MTVDSTGSFAPHYGSPIFECSGTRIRAQCHHLATVVTVSGAVDVMNLDLVSDHSRRFILADKPFVLDLSSVECLAEQGISFLSRIDEDCRTAGVQWALVASPAVTRVLHVTDNDAMFPAAASVPEALHRFADLIATRRRLLLALLSKTS